MGTLSGAQERRCPAFPLTLTTAASQTGDQSPIDIVYKDKCYCTVHAEIIHLVPKPSTGKV